MVDGTQHNMIGIIGRKKRKKLGNFKVKSNQKSTKLRLRFIKKKKSEHAPRPILFLILSK